MADNALNLPPPFDEQLQPKEAFWGIVDPSRLLGQGIVSDKYAEDRSVANEATPAIH
ncbi:MAG: hypothetical protein R2932_53320 [Caldilineaceae bacterium]